jgi:hypothetical protein
MEYAMKPGRYLAAALAALAVSAAATPLLAREPQPGPVAAALTSLSPAERTAALDAIRAKVRELYVFPERRQVIIDRLNAGQKAGRYNLASPAAFVEAVSADLAAASGDKHMYLVVDPAQYAASLAPAGQDGAALDALFAERARRDDRLRTQPAISLRALYRSLQRHGAGGGPCTGGPMTAGQRTRSVPRSRRRPLTR